MRQKSTDVCMCVCGPRSTEPVWTRPYLIREDTRNAIKSDKAGTSANLTNDWWNLSSGSDLIYFFLFVSLFDTHTAYSLTHEHLFWSHKHYEHTDVTFTHLWTHTLAHTHVHIWLTLQRSWWIYGCLVSCVILMSSVAHEGTLKPTPDSMTEGPNYHSHGRERERESVCCGERVQRRGAERKAEIESERRSACACIWYKHDRLISHQWPFKVFSIGTPDLFTWCQ